VSHVRELDSHFIPLSGKNFLKLVYDLVVKIKYSHSFNDESKLARKQFYYPFVNRHRQFSMRRA
jgi:hypothetical protein